MEFTRSCNVCTLQFVLKTPNSRAETCDDCKPYLRGDERVEIPEGHTLCRTCGDPFPVPIKRGPKPKECPGCQPYYQSAYQCISQRQRRAA